jgi:hypothetical protein
MSTFFIRCWTAMACDRRCCARILTYVRIKSNACVLWAARAKPSTTLGRRPASLNSVEPREFEGVASRSIGMVALVAIQEVEAPFAH